jgi:hypothetical protein
MLPDRLDPENFSQSHLLAARFGSLIGPSNEFYRPGIIRQLLDPRAVLVRESLDGRERTESPRAALEAVAAFLWSSALREVDASSVMGIVCNGFGESGVDAVDVLPYLEGCVRIVEEDGAEQLMYVRPARAALIEAVQIAPGDSRDF